MKFLSVLTVFLIFYFIYGFYIGQKDFSVVPVNIKREHAAEFYDYKGVTNVRTDLSSGSSGPQEVISEAKKAELDFLILTDVNQLDRYDNFDGYHDNMLTFAQGEYPFLDMRLLHYSPSKNEPPTDLNDLRLYFTDILSQKNDGSRNKIVVLAHPFNDGPTWTGPFPAGIDGIEILNPKSISKRGWSTSKINVLWSLFCYPFNPNLAFLRLFQEPQEETALWDKVLSERQVWGFAGADASARAIPFASYLMKFPSYQKSFEIATNHVLLQDELNGNFQKDKIKILEAFRKGQFYFSLDLLGDPKGFVSYIQGKEKIHPMGSKLKFRRHLILKTRLPAEPRDFYEIVVFKNGEREAVSNQTTLNYEISSPGVYRVVVRVSAFLPIPDGKKWITWIYTNPFIIY
jgi:hypothetical protein